MMLVYQVESLESLLLLSEVDIAKQKVTTMPMVSVT